MARQAEKSLVKSNAAKIDFLRKAALGINALFILVRLVWCYNSTSRKTWFLYIMTNIVAGMIQVNLEKLGRPRYAADGSLKSAGEDLGQAGVTEYLTDIIYMTWIIYFCVALITDYAWLLFFTVMGRCKSEWSHLLTIHRFRYTQGSKLGLCFSR